MNKECSELLNEINSNRAKIYYQLNQLGDLTGMSLRSLKYRMKIIKEKYYYVPTLLHRDGRAWQIHYTILNEFMPKYKKSQTTVRNHKWETLLTWNTVDSYDKNYHVQLISEVKKQLPYVNIGYVIEVDGRGFNHVHAVTDGYKENVKAAVDSVLSKYIAKKQYRCQIENINNRGSITNYLSKNGEITIL
jgi:hypothetical protein